MTKEIQLFLLPFAGGNSLSFKQLLPLIDSRVETFTIEYAGRLTRSKENFIEDYEDFLKDTATQISKYRKANLPYALFGYSLGAFLACDLLANNLIQGRVLHAFFCAKGSPFKAMPRYTPENCRKENFVKEIIALGGIDKKIVADKRFLEAYMRPIRADFIALGTYRYHDEKIPCNATAIYAPDDAAAFGIEDWALIVEKNFDFYALGKGHFFINENFAEVAQIINARLF